MFSNIPAELKALRQWVVWRYEKREGAKDTKVPYNVRTRHRASVTNPADWCSFEEATQAFEASGGELSGIGFVLTKDDEFAFIDLDDTHGDQAAYDRQVKIYNEFASYSELSPSGSGMHILVKGAVPHGRKRAFVEIYSDERYMTMTGNVVRNMPVVEHNDLLNVLWAEMGGPPTTYVYGEKQEQTSTDDEVMGIALNAANGHKFDQLFKGDWHNEYNSQSEADQALMNILAYYTQNRAQLMRLFRASELGQRDKAQRDRYLDYTINKAFDRQLPPLDLEGFLIQFRTATGGRGEPGSSTLPPSAAGHASEATSDSGSGTPAHAPEPLHASPYSPAASTFPPGLLGQIAQFIFDAAPRPVAEIALAGAIGFMAGLTGRAFNVSGTGLNHYILVLAATGTGKEAIANGCDKLMDAVATQLPNAADFRGPSEIASLPGLIKWLAEKPACFSILGEFGLRMAEMSSARANSHQIAIKRGLTDLYHKSGKGAVMHPFAYSDKEKNTKSILSPALTVIGESVPERFYEVLSEELIADGLLPRFTLIEYTGKRPPHNEAGKSVRPRIDLVEQVRSLAAYAMQLAHNGSVLDVPMNQEAAHIFDLFDKWCDACINDDQANEVTRQLWNRAHLKALKLAALVSVGINYTHPMIGQAEATWATNLVAGSTNKLIAKFKSGEIGDNGSSESKQLSEVVKAIRFYMTEPYARIEQAYGIKAEMAQAGIIPFAFIQRKLVSLACFRHDRQGATSAIKRAIDILLSADELREVPKTQLQAQFGQSPRSFIISNPAVFAE